LYRKLYIFKKSNFYTGERENLGSLFHYNFKSKIESGFSFFSIHIFPESSNLSIHLANFRTQHNHGPRTNRFNDVDAMTAEMLREIIESLRVIVKISVTTYELPSSTISSFFLGPIISRASRNSATRDTHASTHACTRAIDVRHGALPALWAIVSPIFELTIARGSGGQVRAATPSTPRPFLFSLERGHVTLWRRRNRRLPSSNPAVYMSGVWSLCSCQASASVCVRRLVRRWNVPVLLAARMDGFVFAI